MISMFCLLVGLAVFFVSAVCKFVWWLLGLCAFFIVAALLLTVGVSSVLVLPLCLAASLLVGGVCRLLFH